MKRVNVAVATVLMLMSSCAESEQSSRSVLASSRAAKGAAALNCVGAYAAYYSNGFITVIAKGSHETPGYTVKLTWVGDQPCPPILHVRHEPPEWIRDASKRWDKPTPFVVYAYWPCPEGETPTVKIVDAKYPDPNHPRKIEWDKIIKEPPPVPSPPEQPSEPCQG